MGRGKRPAAKVASLSAAAKGRPTDEDQLDEILAEHETYDFLVGLVREPGEDPCQAHIASAGVALDNMLGNLKDIQIPHHRGLMMQTLEKNKQAFCTSDPDNLPALLCVQIMAIATCLACMIDSVCDAFQGSLRAILNSVGYVSKTMRTHNMAVMRASASREKDLRASLALLQERAAQPCPCGATDMIVALREEVRQLRSSVDLLQVMMLDRRASGPGPTTAAWNRSASPGASSHRSARSHRSVASAGSNDSVATRISDAQAEAFTHRGGLPAWAPVPVYFVSGTPCVRWTP
jgi:hypothetical protein